MDEDEKIEKFRKIEAELFKRVEAGFTAYKTEEGNVGIKWKHDADLLDTLGLMTVLEEEIARNFVCEDGNPVRVDREDDIYEADLDLTTTVGLRDKLCSLFPTVVVGYLLQNEKPGDPEIKTRYIGKTTDCLGLLRWMSFDLRNSTPEIFNAGEAIEEEFGSSVLEVRAHESGQIIIISGPNVLHTAGYAALALGKAAELVYNSIG